jgi:hypothetical protein
MTTLTQRFSIAAALYFAATGAFAQGGASAQAANTPSTAQVSPNEYTVFVDEPTGYAFIKTPSGWKFMKQLNGAQIQDALAMEAAGTPHFAVAHMPSTDMDSSSVALLSTVSTF